MISMPIEIWMQTLVLLVAVLYLLRLSRVFRPSETRHASNSPPADREHPVDLHQVYPTSETELETDIDIIAIHGFDTKSPDTWIWKSGDGSTCVNWLSDINMLPSRVGKARIFTCNWPSNLFEDSSYVQKTLSEFAKRLFTSIDGLSSEKKEPDYKQRPTIFIASCLGGIVLMKALVHASPKYFEKVMPGIVFLATPFGGTSFLDVAEWAEPGLRGLAFIRAEKISNLLYKTTLSADLAQLRRDFTERCENKYIISNHMTAFYETGKSSLPRKLFPWLPECLALEKALVSQESASLDIITDFQALERKHSLMNKFPGPDDRDYNLVAGRIQMIIQRIRDATPLYKADAWINDRCYDAKRLAIQRISGENVPMKTCFINLIVIENPTKMLRTQQNQKQSSSQFSLHNRLKIQAPEEHKKIDIQHLFDPREEGPPPRRILIRGHAGVGKSTLCKKMVHDFKELDMWRSSFARILWVPLRNLKKEYDLEPLLKKEFFLNCPESKKYANQLLRELTTDTNQKTLFILDGLDEVREGLEAGHKMYNLLQTLLERPAVIVTCRPYVSLANQQQLKFDLELETIGFSPGQVDLYVKNVLSTSQKSPAETTSASQEIDDLLALLQRHQLLRDLVRIPIQLDALCYIWASSDDSLRSGTKFETMTSVYQAVMTRLWRKDIPELRFEDRRRTLTRKDMDDFTLEMIEGKIFGELYLLQRLAFSGMVTDTISFEKKDWQSIIGELQSEASSSSIIITEPFLRGQNLPRLSFWRASDPVSGNPDYHFLHLTFQEYFAARYFVRQWKKQEPLKLQLNRGNKSQPVEAFLADHRYDARYDVFWRFVAGLLSLEETINPEGTPVLQGTETCQLFDKIEKVPLDLLGSVHQRLIMHCLSEVPPDLPDFCSKRKELEKQLGDWLLLEDKIAPIRVNIRAMEVPEASLVYVLESTYLDRSDYILDSLRRTMPPQVIHLLCSWLKADAHWSPKFRTCEILLQQQRPLVEKALRILGEEDQLDDQEISAIRRELENARPLLDSNKSQKTSRELRSMDSLASQVQHRPDTPVVAADLGHDILDSLRARAQDHNEDKGFRVYAIGILMEQQKIDNNIHDIIGEWLRQDDRELRFKLLKALTKWPQPDDHILNMVAGRLNVADSAIQAAALEVLENWRGLSDEVIYDIAKLLNSPVDWVRDGAVAALRNRPQPEERIIQIIKSRLKQPREDKDGSMRVSLLGTLSEWNRLDHDILSAVSGLLHHETDNDVEYILEVFEILRCHPQPPDEILEAIKSFLKQPSDYRLKIEAIETLGSWSQLSEELLEDIATCLEDADRYISTPAFYALTNQTVLPFMVLKPHMGKMFDFSLRFSFEQHIYWLAGEKPCLAIGARRVYWANKVGDKPGLCPEDIKLMQDCADEWAASRQREEEKSPHESITS